MGSVVQALGYEFAGFRLEPANALFHAGGVVRLAPKEFALLSSLVAAAGAGALVTKDELAERVWGAGGASD